MQTLAHIRALLEARGLSPRKSLGQNFLIDHNLINKLIDAANPAPNDIILEIGPGTGVLTEALLARNLRVVASELDQGLAALLRETITPRYDSSRFTLVQGDCLAGKHALNPNVLAALESFKAASLADPADSTFTMIANLPYAAATPAMLVLLADHPRCKGFFVTIQHEVADRMLAKPHSKDYGPLSVLVAATSRAWHIAKLPPECFWPRPGVISSMIGVTRHPPSSPATLTTNPRALVDFAQSLFVQRRKQIGSILGRDREYPAGITSTMRAEELTPAQFVQLMNAPAPSANAT